MNNNINRQGVVNFICEHAIDIVSDLSVDIINKKKEKAEIINHGRTSRNLPPLFL